MSFFKSVFSDDPDPDPDVEASGDNDSNSPPRLAPDSKSTAEVGEWSFGGLIKSITARSETVIETYRRDLTEFRSGLKKEIEVAHGSLGTVGHAIDEFGSNVIKGTAQIISQGKNVILDADHESDSDSNTNQYDQSQRGMNSKPYSRLDAQVRAIEGDMNTYCEEPEELDDYKKWKLGFVLEGKKGEIDSLLEENGAVNTIYKKIVPSSIDNEAFWSRYFYKVHKLKQAEDMRVNLVKRAISREEEEELSWDVDDDEEEEEEKPGSNGKMGDKVGEERFKVGGNGISSEEANLKMGENEIKEVKKDNSEALQIGIFHVDVDVDVAEVERSSFLDSEAIGSVEDRVILSNKGSGATMEDSMVKVGVESKSDHGESSKDSEVSIVSSQPSMAEAEEEDLGWDEIEDLSSIDDKKVNHVGSQNRIDVRKHLHAVEEDEDLSWDIEEDDEPAKHLK